MRSSRAAGGAHLQECVVPALRQPAANVPGLRQPAGPHRTERPALQTSGGLTLDATALQATILGIPITIVAADLPEGQLALPGLTLPPLPADLGLVTVQLFVLSIQSGAVSLSEARITTAAC